MQCLNCGFDNPTGMKFCGECGAALKNICSQCGFENPLNFKFCGQCGAALPADRPSTPPPVAYQALEAERRHITVLFSDLAGSTLLSQKLDPEELRRVIKAYQEVCAAAIKRFEGYVAQYLGDGVMAYFGYPIAHEDDAQRAVRAGLAILAAVEQLNVNLQQELSLTLTLRLGLHTGLVVVGPMDDDHRREPLALGETPNIAARLQSLAQPNSVVISSHTYRLVQGYFDCRPLGQQRVKGIGQLLTLYQVLQERATRDRLDAAQAAGLTPLVGRVQELQLLAARWEEVRERRGQVVVLTGEAGIGKSRLVRVLKEQLAGQPHTWLECHASALHQHSALHPIIELLHQILEFSPTDSPVAKVGQLEAGLAHYLGQVMPPAETVPLLATLLGLPVGEEYAPLNLAPRRQKQRTLEIILTLLLAMADRKPLLFVVEDLHWLDPSTLELLDLLIEQGSTTRLLALFTCRPTFNPAWRPYSYLTHLTLSRLTQPQVEAMVQQVAGGKRLPGDLLRQVAAKTDGVPLFVEELTKMVLELDLLTEAADHYELAAPLPPLAIPSTLHDSLMARLDRLASVKEVAQLAATLGREFDYGLLQAVSHLPEPELQLALAQLVQAELLYQRGLPPAATYLFKHALIQETAYRSLLRSRRQQYHAKIAQVLVEQFPQITQLQPELVAHHYTAAGLAELAVLYWQQAGQRAIEQSAAEEAIDHLARGLKLLEALPDMPARTEQKLALQLLLGVPLLMSKGYAALEVERTYARAWQLCRQLGDTPQQAPALFGLWLFYLVRADYQLAGQLGDQLMALAQRLQEPALLLAAHQVQGINCFYLGELTSARTHLEQALELYRPEQAAGRFSYSGADQGVATLSHLALTLWLLGYPDQALQQAEAALALAERLAHPFSQAFALSMAALLHQYRREGQLAQARAEAALAYATGQGFELLAGFSAIFRGWALAEQGQVELGMSQLRQGLDAFRATGAELGQLHFLALLAETCGRAGQVEAGLSLLEEALTAAHDKGERFYEAELYRLKGELLWQAGQQSAPEASFQKAIQVARSQSARSLELRASLNLSRLWAVHGQPAKAGELLAGSYTWFTEGFETADLRDAKALLASLG